MTAHSHATDVQRALRGHLPAERPAAWPRAARRGWALLAAHVNDGLTIRDLADQEHVPPSTIRAWLRSAERCAWRVLRVAA